MPVTDLLFVRFQSEPRFRYVLLHGTCVISRMDITLSKAFCSLS
uniref:Uncharacterized protein n=1 Tax=Anguilla anguilla TaxID=7936 RepID=A0A0E9RJA0_ANGAN